MQWFLSKAIAQYNQLHHLPYRMEGQYLTQKLANEHPLMSLV